MHIKLNYLIKHIMKNIIDMTFYLNWYTLILKVILIYTYPLVTFLSKNNLSNQSNNFSIISNPNPQQHLNSPIQKSIFIHDSSNLT